MNAQDQLIFRLSPSYGEILNQKVGLPISLLNWPFDINSSGSPGKKGSSVKSTSGTGIQISWLFSCKSTRAKISDNLLSYEQESDHKEGIIT